MYKTSNKNNIGAVDVVLVIFQHSGVQSAQCSPLQWTFLQYQITSGQMPITDIGGNQSQVICWTSATRYHFYIHHHTTSHI